MAKLKDLYVSAFKNYKDFSGRANRAEFSVFFITNLIIAIIISVLSPVIVYYVLMSIYPSSYGGALGILWFVYSLGAIIILNIIFGLIILAPTISLTTSRLHDINLNGWYQIILWLTMPLFLIISIIGFIMLCAVSGTEGENQYGMPSEITLG